VIVGLGTDIVEIDRIEAQVTKSDRLAKRVLTPDEHHIFEQHMHPARYLAKRFAAKEAAVKALGTGIGHGISWQHITISNNELGQPQLTFHDEFAEQCRARGVTHSFVSISDEKHYAVATVILEAN
jgi:holo-[acyl-carrier protein] synthase